VTTDSTSASASSPARILITGAGRGIGLALTRRRLERGDLVFALARTPSAALTELARESARLTILTGSVTDPDAIALARKTVGNVVDGLDWVVNNAAISCGPQRAPGFDFEVMERVLQTNTIGPARIYDAFTDLLRLGRAPRLVNLSSEAASLTTFRKSKKPDYAMSKVALNALTRWIALEEPLLITVAVDPGWTRTTLGGDDGLSSPAETATVLSAFIEGLTPPMSGGFFAATGERLPF
jgi:NAD(P)-dependent dehydrogenase (short-subunit alcohol dehydrogenase family)